MVSLPGLVIHDAWAAEWTYMEQTRVQWQPYETATFEAAQAANRPVLVLVYADWCAWCKKYELETLEQPAIRRRLQREWVPVAVDYDRQPQLAQQLGVRLVPTTLLLTPDAQKLQRFFGMVGPEALAANLDEVRGVWQRGDAPEGDFGDENTCCPLDDPSPERGQP